MADMEDAFGHVWASHLRQRVLASQQCSWAGQAWAEQGQNCWAQ